MTRSISSRVLALLLLGAAISSGVLSAPTLPPLSSSPKFSTEVQPVQSRSSPDQGSLLGLQRRDVEHANLNVPRSESNSAVQTLNLNKRTMTRTELEKQIAIYNVQIGVWLGGMTRIDGRIRRENAAQINQMRAAATAAVQMVGNARDPESLDLKAKAENILNSSN
ncbi:hypothetical protein EV360DRAFT_84156 [Lentinula raphanica]|nr:hypothetical protein EV360DRAFT_84156 [Lentinula raphanica]